MSTRRATPEELRAPRGARVIEIVWADGATTPIHHRTLRGFCPCAHCQGHQGPIEWVAGTAELPEGALELVEIEEVGQYAVQLSWGDGHRTGIYSFSYLRELAEVDGLSESEKKSRKLGR